MLSSQTPLFSEIHFHCNAIRIADENLVQSEIADVVFAKRNTVLLQVLQRRRDIAAPERDVIERAGIAARFATAIFRQRAIGAKQMHHRHVAAIEPVARETQLGPRAFLQSQYIAIEVAGALEVQTVDGVVLESFQRHLYRPVGALLNGTSLSTRISCGRPSTRSAMMLRKISSVPPAMRRPGALIQPIWNMPCAGASSPFSAPTSPSSSVPKAEMSCSLEATTILAIEASGPGCLPWLSAVIVR